jgi:hypothetical protein
MDPMDTTDKYLVIATYLSVVSIGSIFLTITKNIKKMDAMDTSDKYLVIATYLSVVSIGPFFLITHHTQKICFKHIILNDNLKSTNMNKILSLKVM